MKSSCTFIIQNIRGKVRNTTETQRHLYLVMLVRNKNATECDSALRVACGFSNMHTSHADLVGSILPNTGRQDNLQIWGNAVWLQPPPTGQQHVQTHNPRKIRLRSAAQTRLIGSVKKDRKLKITNIFKTPLPKTKGSSWTPPGVYRIPTSHCSDTRWSKLDTCLSNTSIERIVKNRKSSCNLLRIFQLDENNLLRISPATRLLSKSGCGFGLRTNWFLQPLSNQNLFQMIRGGLSG